MVLCRSEVRESYLDGRAHSGAHVIVTDSVSVVRSQGETVSSQPRRTRLGNTSISGKVTKIEASKGSHRGGGKEREREVLKARGRISIKTD